MLSKISHRSDCRVHEAPPGEYVGDEDCDCGAVVLMLRRRIIELENAIGRLIDYCDAATHGDEQYSDERSNLIRILRGN